MLSPVARLLALASLVGLAGAQTTYYVDVNGTAPGSGTLADPYTSIQAALSNPAIDDGDTVSVAPGSYTEGLTFPPHGVRVVATGGADVTTIHGSILIGFDGLPISELDGFTVLPLGGATGILMCGGRIKRCIVRGNGIAAGIEIDNWFSFVENSVISGFSIGIEQTAPLGGAVFHVSDSILRNNALDILEEPYSPAAVSTIERTAFNAGTYQFITVTNAIVEDPELWLPAESDYHLRPGSPCIDAGDPSAPLDADGSIADVGVFPFDPTYAPTPDVYCTSKVSSDGCLPTIGSVGLGASLGGAAPFHVTATNLPEFKNGLFYFGLGTTPFPYQGGWFCIQPPTLRTPVQSSGSSGTACSGSFTIDFSEFLISAAPGFLAPGDLIYGQYWLRDPGDPFGSLRTDAVRFGLTP